MRVIDFSHPEWRALAQQLLGEAPQVIRGRQWQPALLHKSGNYLAKW